MTSAGPRRVAVVTGATRGLGELTARHLLAQGWAVAICSRKHTAAFAASFASNGGSEVVGVDVDVADSSRVADFAELVVERLGPPDLVINNAAVLGPVGTLVTVDLDGWTRALAIDVAGVANVTARFAEYMIPRRRGKILALSGGGVGGPRVSPRISAYTTSKAAVAMLVEGLAAELAPFDIQVNAVAPGAMPTDFTAGILEAGPEIAGGDLYESTRRNAADDGDFARFARLIDYLASQRSNWLSGRLLSARWETPEALEANRPEIEAGDRFKMRRIDATLYDEHLPT